MKRALIAAAALFLAASAWAAGLSPPLPALGGDRELSAFPESAKLRAGLYARWLAGSRDEVLAGKPFVLTNEYGDFRFSSTRSGDAFYVILAAAKGRDFPLYSQGTWIVKRSVSDGSFIQAKVFLRSDPGCFIRVYPDGQRSRMDLVLYGAVLNKEVSLPVGFDEILASPLSDIVGWSRDSVEWSLFSPRPEDYEGLASFAGAIRKRLPSLRYADDGGLDAEGRPVLIASGQPQGGKPGLNCSGFVQWVVDGLLAPLGAPLPGARELARKHPELRGMDIDPALDARYDPFFGLDWTRNLGQAAAEAREPENAHGTRENDIDLSAFALFASSSDPMNGGKPYEDYPAYNVDSGYRMSGLRAILYVLAMREPGNAYLASLSRQDSTGLRRHYHTALLLPWFDGEGRFKVDVFESAAETSLEAMMRRAPKDYVHLVRLPVGFSAGGDFAPPNLR
jgi:hypothetical protein